MADMPDFTKYVPGFDFLQGLTKTAGASLPHIGQWVAPTLDPEDLDKRIQELRTVQFWLEQNTQMLSTTIQALEVQRMTLATLKTMNVPISSLHESMKIAVPGMGGLTTAVPGASAKTGKASAKTAGKQPSKEEGKAAAAPPAVDPMQWWGALSQQFAQLASQAVKQGGAGLSQHLSEAVAGKSDAPKPKSKAKTSTARKRKSP